MDDNDIKKTVEEQLQEAGLTVKSVTVSDVDPTEDCIFCGFALDDDGDCVECMEDEDDDYCYECGGDFIDCVCDEEDDEFCDEEDDE